MMLRFHCHKPKARSNFIKHGIRFTEGCRIFSGHVLTGPSKQNTQEREPRYVTIGLLSDQQAAVVVWTPRDGGIRLISVRVANRSERERYHAYIKKAVN